VPGGPDGAEAPQLVDLGWRRIIRVSVARAALGLVLSLLVWSLLPLLAGMTPRVILSGSMEPRIHVGDVVVTRHVPVATLTKGQVITVKDPDHPGRTRTHRLFRRAADGTIVTKGDANPQADSSHVEPGNVLGLAVIRVPYVGRPVYWLAERNLPALGATVLVLAWTGISAFAPTRRERRSDGRDDRDDPGASDLSGPRRRSGPSHRVRQVAAVAAVTAVSVGMAVAPAEAAFRRTTSTPVSNLSAASSFQYYRSSVLGDSPSFYWRLDETSGSAVDDETSNGRDATLASASSSWSQAGAITSESSNTALKVSQAAVTANTAVSGPAAFSVEAWFKTTSSNGGRILGFGNGSGVNASSTVDRQLYLGTNGKTYFGVGSSKTVVASASTLDNGAWHHVVGTYTSGSRGMKLYVDGKLQGSATATPVSMSGYWRAGAEGMSGWTSNPGQYFDGTLDELAVYNKALTASQVKEHYDDSGA
jgi:signal peptidase I